MVSPDPGEALRLYLLADAAVAALVDGRVYVGRMRRTETDNQPRHAVIIRTAGGPGVRSYMRFHRQRYDVRCYGSSDALAMDLHQAVFDALKSLYRATQGSTVLADALAENVGLSLVEPETDWPFVLSTWSVGVHEEALS